MEGLRQLNQIGQGEIDVMGRIKRFKPPKVSTVVGQGTAISGDLAFSGGLHLDGRVTGNVSGEADTRSTLTVSELGVIEGDVRVENLILNGTVIGDVYASERVELATNARVSGTVYYRLLEMAMGAEVNGKLVHTEVAPKAMLGYEGPAEAEPDKQPVPETPGNT
jgi:cytoskeletal protein CcmA (bactofilin family)